MNQKGFSLMEIMVAIVLIATVLLGIPFGSGDGDRRRMNDSIENLDRAIRFAAGEAVLRNSLVRIQFNLDAQPQEFVVEYASDSKLTLNRSKDLSRLNLSEREKENAKLKKFDQNFTQARDFSDSPVQVADDITIEGVVTSYMNQVIREGQIGIYFYPAGERDNAAIFFSSYSEVGMLSVASFESRTTTDFLALEKSDQASYDSSRDQKIEQLYQLWLKD